jgi:hypothetical protein
MGWLGLFSGLVLLSVLAAQVVASSRVFFFVLCVVAENPLDDINLEVDRVVEDCFLVWLDCLFWVSN